MKATEIRPKSKEELAKSVNDYRDKLRGLRFDLASGKVKNIREIRKIKRDVARILTILKEK